MASPFVLRLWSQPVSKLHPTLPQKAPSCDSSDVIVIGGGPVGMRVAQLVAQNDRKVTLLSDEPYEPYNRVRLTPLLGGDVQFGEIALDAPPELSRNLDVRVGQRVVNINREERSVTTSDGSVWTFRALVIATGSRSFIPQIPGADLPGVYAFRTAADASALLARTFSARRAVITGGGLLGLEAARGLSRRNCQVTIIEHENRLMPASLMKVPLRI
jgi:nitrite reductase (NADH) large subunit